MWSLYIGTHFNTCHHDSDAVEACAKLCTDSVNNIWIMTHQNTHQQMQNYECNAWPLGFSAITTVVSDPGQQLSRQPLLIRDDWASFIKFDYNLGRARPPHCQCPYKFIGLDLTTIKADPCLFSTAHIWRSHKASNGKRKRTQRRPDRHMHTSPWRPFNPSGKCRGSKLNDSNLNWLIVCRVLWGSGLNIVDSVILLAL